MRSSPTRSAATSISTIQSVFGELGAAIDNRHGARVGVKLNGHTAVFHNAKHSLPKEEVVQIRHFLETCGISPDDYPI